ncbi:hypothetical protein ACFL5M_00430 [Candidatus Neomarinimicrobiota bacterium]
MKVGSVSGSTLLACLIMSGAGLFGQGLTLKGQLWTSLTLGDDPASSRSNVEQTIGYIPSLSLARQLGPLSVLDLEFAYNLGALMDGALGNGEAGTETSSKLYRLWGRFATESLELRLGLQKIAFGPGRVLRPLMWFDTFDLKDPTGQTDGVSALRLRWFPWHNLALWGWVIRPDYREFASPGGRIELGMGAVETGLSYHHRKNSGLDFTGRQLLPFDNEEERFALDARWDGFIGLWTEAVITRGTELAFDDEINTSTQVMIGGDYTLPWGNGVYVTLEHLWSRSDIGRRYVEELYDADATYLEGFREEQTDQVTLLMVSIPWGMFDNVMGLQSYDWENQRQSNFLMWQRSYDALSLNLILYSSPERKDYYLNDIPIPLPETLTGFGNGIQFMIVFNH